MCGSGGRQSGGAATPVPAALVEASGKLQVGGKDSMANRAAAAGQDNVKTSMLGASGSTPTTKKTLLGQ